MAREDEAMRMLAGQVSNGSRGSYIKHNIRWCTSRLSLTSLQVREMMGHIHDSLSTQPRAVEELRAVVDASMQRTQDDMEHVQRSISGGGWGSVQRVRG